MSDGKVIISTELDNSQFKKGISEMKSELGGLSGTLKKIGKIVAAAFSVHAIVSFSKQAIELGSNVQEVQNVVDTAFGDMAYKVEEFAKTSVQNFGMSKLSAKKTASTYMAMARGMGIAQAEASDMAIALTGLTGDVASFYNISQELADVKLRSVFTGETETLKDLGIVMTQTNLQAFALSQGISKNLSDMSQAELVALRYKFVMQQLALANGDFAKTQDSWANQTRILSEQWKEFMSIIGQALITIFTPLVRVLNTIVAALINMANVFNAAISAIFGTSNKQIQQVQSSASGVGSAIGESVDNQNALTDATKGTTAAQKKSNAEAKKTLAAFDEINKLSDNSASGSGGGSGGGAGGGGGGSSVGGGLQVVESDPLGDGANKLTEFFMELQKALEPTRQALARLWDQLKLVGTFTGAALVDFYNNFLKPVGNWVLGEGLPRFIDAITNGLAAVDWQKINDALNTLWNALAPFAINVGEGLLWFWENVLVPLGSWTMSNIVPLFLEILAAAIDILNGVIEALKPLGKWLWDNFLQPIASWTGGVIISVLSGLRDALRGISDWCKEHKTTIQNIAVAIGSFMAAWAIVDVATTVWEIVSALASFVSTGGLATAISSALAAATAAICSPVTLVTIAIGALIVIIATLITHWDDVKKAAETAWNNIKSAWNTAANWFDTTVVQPVKGFFSGLWTDIDTAASTAWTNIKETFGKAKEWFEDNVTNPVKDAFKTAINSMIGFAEGFANRFIRGINKIISAINSISFDLPDVIGGGHIGFNIPTISEISLPRLAQGAVIPPNREFLAMLGDQSTGTNIEAPLETIKQALHEVIAETGGAGGEITLRLVAGKGFVRDLSVELDKDSRRRGVKLVKGGAFT